MKKLLLGLTTTAVIVAPLATVVSCGNGAGKSSTQQIDSGDSKVDNQHEDANTVVQDIKTHQQKIDEFEAFTTRHASDLTKLDYKEIEKMTDPNIQWKRGIANFSLSQGASYLYNLAKELGFKDEDQPIANVNEDKTEQNADPKVRTDRDEAYEYYRNLFDTVKIKDQAGVQQVLDSVDFQQFAGLSSVGRKMTQKNLPYEGIDDSAFGNPIKASPTQSADLTVEYEKFNFTTSSGTNLRLNQESHMSVFQYIDGEHPGTTIARLQIPAIELRKLDDNGQPAWTEEGDPIMTKITSAFSKSFTVQGLQPVYPVETKSDREHDLNVLEGVVRKLADIFDNDNKDEIDSLKKMASYLMVPESLIDAFGYLGKNFESNGGFNLDDLAKAFDKLNNGSHYFKAFEVLARGVTGVSFHSNVASPVDASSTDYQHDGIMNLTIQNMANILQSWSVNEGYFSFHFGQPGTMDGNNKLIFAGEKDIRNYHALQTTDEQIN